MSKKVAIIGGGITGLAAAYELERSTSSEVTLFESTDRLGGKIRTDKIDDFLVEQGPDCYFTRKPGVNDLVCELGLEDEVLAPSRNEFSILINGKLERIPAGLVTLTQSNPDVIDQAHFLSHAARERVKEEPNQPKGSGADESIRTFFDRRFGTEFTRVIVEPLLAGTHGGSPETLSIRALFPAYAEMEDKYGSLAGVSSPPPSGKPTFLSFRNGMQTLVDALVNGLKKTKIHFLSSPSLQEIEADYILVATPSNTAANLFEPKAPGLAKQLRSIRHYSSAIHTFAFDRSQIDHELDATGYLVPPDQTSNVTGSTWSSQKWSNRAPNGKVLIRIFSQASASAFEALNEIQPLLGITGKPIFELTTAWIDAMPQYEVGHIERIQAIQQTLASLPNISIAGTSYGGVGIPDCIQQGRNAAYQIAQQL